MAVNAGDPPVKIMIVGDSCVGKTCILFRFAQGEFPSEYIPTIFDNFSTGMGQPTPLDGLFLIDTAGGQDYDDMRPGIYPGTDIVIITFSCCNTESLRNVQRRWWPEVRQYLPNVLIFLVCAQIDRRDPAKQQEASELVTPRPLTTRKEGRDMAKLIGAYAYLETSALDGIGITELFDACREAAPRNRAARPRGGTICTLL